MEAAGNAAGAAIKDKENKAKESHLDKISESEEKCRADSRAAIANATATSSASLLKKEQQMELHRQSVLAQQKYDLDNRIALVLEQQRALYLQKEKLHQDMRDRELQIHNHNMEELLNREKWLLQLAQEEVAQRKKDEKALIAAAKAANDKKIAEEKAAAEEKARLDAIAYNTT